MRGKLIHVFVYEGVFTYSHHTHTHKPTISYHQTFNLVILFITITYTESNLQLLLNSNNAPKTAHMKVHNYSNHLNAFKRIKSGCKYSLTSNCFEYVRVYQVLGRDLNKNEWMKIEVSKRTRRVERDREKVGRKIECVIESISSSECEDII